MSTSSSRIRFLAVIASAILAATAFTQGPGSCGFHLDILADSTSTHAAVADIPGAPGSLPLIGMPPGAPGNPYTAWATPGTVVKLRLSIPGGMLGAAPIGPGSLISIVYSAGTPNIGIFPVPLPLIAPCTPGQPLIVSVLPAFGTLIDGTGISGAIPLTPPADPGHPAKLELPLFYPAGIPAVPVMFQAVVLTAAGGLALSNGAALLPGPNPAEATLVPGLIPLGPFPALDEGFSTTPTPPGFTFYGAPAPFSHVNTNGFINFGLPPVLPDFAGSPGDFGCLPATPEVSPRISVNHFDADGLTPPRMPAAFSDITLEIAPPGPGTPTRHIYRWKSFPNFGSPPGPLDTNDSTHVIELWGADTNHLDRWSRMVAVRQEIHSVTTLANHGVIGIGPGAPFQGFGGPPPDLH